MHAQSVQQVLGACPLFAGCDAGVVGQLAALARRRQLEVNELLMVQGSSPRATFVVETGALRVFTASERGDEQTLTMLFAGDTVGELGALDGSPRMASVAAVGRSVVVEVPAFALRRAYATDGSIAHALVTQMATRLRATSDRLGDMVVLDLPARLAKFLVAEVQRQLDDLPRRAEIDLPFTQAQLGQLLGGARQTINRELAGLEERGLIRLGDRRVTVLDLDGLQARCRGGS